MSDIGYKRVSTADQNTLRQLEEVTLDKVFEDKASGKKGSRRPGLAQCLDYLREGDTLHVHSIDRLARSLVDLERIVSDLTERGISIRFHKEGLTFGGRDSAMDRLLFQVMGAFAQFERSLIRERSLEGIRAAQKNGVRFGAPNKLTTEQIAELRRRKKDGESVIDLANDYGISRAGAYLMLKQ